MNLNDIEMEDIYNVLFGMMRGVAMIRYFNPQTIVDHHEGEVKANNCLFL
jgi:hypothetical protein